MDEATKRKLISVGKKRGYITYDELNDALPQEDVSPERIEDFLTEFAELDIKVIDERLKGIKFPETVLVVGKLGAAMQTMSHKEMNLSLEVTSLFGETTYICNVEEPQTLPPFNNLGEIEIAYEDGKKTENSIDIPGKNIPFAYELAYEGEEVELYVKVSQSKADEEPAHSKAECEEIETLVSEALTSIDNGLRFTNIEWLNTGMPPYLTGWELVEDHARIIFPIELKEVDMEEFDKREKENDENDMDGIKTIIDDDGDEVIDLEHYPTIVEFENLGEWLAFEQSRE